jgi:hypothetical protein
MISVVIGQTNSSGISALKRSLLASRSRTRLETYGDSWIDSVGSEINPAGDIDDAAVAGAAATVAAAADVEVFIVLEEEEEEGLVTAGE